MSEHPLAQAIVREAEKNNIPSFTMKDFKRTEGLGVSAAAQGIHILVMLLLCQARIRFSQEAVGQSF